jgi:hypothetical protein
MVEQGLTDLALAEEVDVLLLAYYWRRSSESVSEGPFQLLNLLKVQAGLSTPAITEHGRRRRSTAPG